MIGIAIRNARIQKGLTQSSLAREVKCKQSAISMFESGNAQALSDETVRLIAQKLGLDIKSRAGAAAPARRGLVLKFCPVDDCPSNVPFVTRGQLCFLPSVVEAVADATTRCAYCAEILEASCPSEACGASVRPAAFCPECGSSYVATAETPRGDPRDWADTQRRRIREVLALSRPRRAGETTGADGGWAPDGNTGGGGTTV